MPRSRLDLTKTGSDATSDKPPEFQTPWISIENLSKDAKREKVVDEARTLFAKHKNSNSFIKAEQTEEFNKSWQAFKVSNNWDALRRFFEKEKAYRDTHREYAKKIQEQDGLRGEIEGLKKEIERQRGTAELRRQRSEMLLGMQKSLVQDYQSRFANLPESMCLLGRIEIGPEESAESLGAVVSNVLSKRAIKEKSSFEVSEVLQVIQGDKVVRTISQTDAGRANIIDTYSWIRQSPRFYKYIASRIEVYPYDVLASTKFASAPSGERYPDAASRVEFFRVDEESYDSLSALHMENEAIKKFVTSQLDIIRESGARVKAQVEQLTDQFTKEKLEYETMRADLDAEVTRSSQTIAASQRELDSKTAAAQRLDVAVSELNDALVDKKRAYEEYYRRKISFVNKSVAAKVVLEGSRTLADVFGDLAKSTYSVINDLKQAATRTTVLIESSTGSANILRKIEQREINYTPEVTRFRIVYLTSDDRSGEAYGYVNVAYEIRSTPDVTTLIVKGDSLLDRGGGRTWIRKSELSSANYAAEGMPGGFQVPTLEELHELNKAALRYVEVNDKHPFAALKWALDFPYLSSKRTTDNRGQTIFKTLNFQTEEEEDVSSGDGVYVLWVKSGRRDEQ